jgi:hypothetical protein
MWFKYSVLLNKEEKSIKIKDKTIVGLYEYVTIKGKKIPARIDSGAVRSSIDADLAKELGIKDIIGSKKIRNVHGSTLRPLVHINLVLCEKRLKADFTLQSRTNMKFKILIGQNILMEDFIIDPKKTLVTKE